MRVGLFFGSFNPIHVGHLVIAQTLANTGAVDRVWLVVSPHNPHKKPESLAPAADRLRMAELATQGQDVVQPSNVEFLLPRPSYTIDTLTHLAARYGTYRFSLLMGADNLLSLPRWKHAQAILNHYPVAVYPRLGHPVTPEVLAQFPATVSALEAPIVELSATRIRQWVQQGKSVRFFVPDAAWHYLDTQGLYRV